MLDMLIKGGQVVTPSGVGNWDVGVEGERIVAVALPGVLPEEGATVIDATGKIVVPGGVPPCRSRGCAEDEPPPFDRVSGNLSLAAALEAVAAEGDAGREAARRYLATLRGTTP